MTMAKFSDERREVALYLREAAKGDGWLDEDVCYAIAFAGGFDGRPFGEVLADLIYPTCHNTLPDWGTFECSECGTQWGVCPAYIAPDGTSGHDAVDPRFCPDCGARVVNGDDAC